MPSKNKRYRGLLNNQLQGRITLATLLSNATALGLTEAEVTADVANASKANNVPSDDERSERIPTDGMDATALSMRDGA